VFGVETFRHTLRVNGSGVIKVPLLDPITVAGMTTTEIEAQLRSRLERDLIRNPQVSVFVTEYRSQPVYVLGSVQKPGQYQITLPLKLVDAISLAGGLQPTAGDEVTVQRVSAEGAEQNFTVNLTDLLEKGDLSRNVAVQGGDIIHIRERATETIYVIGEVNRAGAFIKPAKQQWRVSQVIAHAGGPMKTARLGKSVLVRYTDTGAREELPVDFGQILKGKQEDFFVRANDVIYVPGSKFKNFGQTVLNGLPSTLASIPFVVIP
jgi:polysaccharide export outer membrane protein